MVCGQSCLILTCREEPVDVHQKSYKPRAGCSRSRSGYRPYVLVVCRSIREDHKFCLCDKSRIPLSACRGRQRLKHDCSVAEQAEIASTVMCEEGSQSLESQIMLDEHQEEDIKSAREHFDRYELF